MDPDRGEDDIDLSPESIEKLRIQRKSERKEKAEQKLQENLKRIEKMNSKTGIDPVELFPKEIWKMMCELVSPNDRWNLCKVHPMFSGLMESTMISDILLPKVLHLEKFIGAITTPRTINSKSKLLNLRGVCKSLRDAVDNMLQDDLIKTIREDIDNETEVLSVSFSLGGSRDYDAKQLNRLDDILLAAKDTPNMKVFLKSFYVEFGKNYPDFEEFEEVSQKILSLLEIVGDQILYFNYSSHIVYFNGSDEFPCEECYILLQKCVSLMPNLMWLKVHQNGKNFRKNENEEKDAALRAALNRHPFPRLEHLEKISFEYFSCEDEEDVIYMAMLEANPHLRILTAHSNNYYDDSPEDEHAGRGHIEPTQSFRPLDLTAFAIINDAENNGRFGENSFVLVRGMMSTNWKLTNLRLSVDMFYASINELFRFVENFPTLENLFLQTKFVEITDEVTPLLLPNLLKFEIVFEEADIEMEETADLHRFFSMEFLVGCKKLKSLAWIYSWNYWTRNVHQFWNLLYKGDAPDRFRNGLLNCWKEERDLQEADIWTLFPCLEHIKVGSPKQARQSDKYIIECRKGKF